MRFLRSAIKTIRHHLEPRASLMTAGAREYVQLPGGHPQGWSDALANLFRSVYTFISERDAADRPARLAFPTFDNGYGAACIVEPVLASHANGGVWTKVEY